MYTVVRVAIGYDLIVPKVKITDAKISLLRCEGIQWFAKEPNGTLLVLKLELKSWKELIFRGKVRGFTSTLFLDYPTKKLLKLWCGRAVKFIGGSTYTRYQWSPTGLLVLVRSLSKFGNICFFFVKHHVYYHLEIFSEQGTALFSSVAAKQVRARS